MKTPHVKLIGRSPLRLAFLISLVLLCFGLSPKARGVDPPPDGGYLNQNTAEGEDALFSLTTGTSNTALGYEALFADTTGYENTAAGFQALYSNTEGLTNTAMGANALYANTTGLGNTATGASALKYNTTGAANTATGAGTLLFSTTGSGNTATGFNVLNSNTTGSENTAEGFHTLISNRTGRGNTAIGTSAMLNNSTGSSNIAVGSSAGLNLTTGNNNIDIGNPGVAAESRTIRIGTKGTHNNTFVAGISGVTVAGGVNVVIDTSGHLGTSTSSARFKENIQLMERASEAILSLEPVSFRYKKELDPAGIRQFGLIAEDVAKVNSDLVARDGEGKPYSVRYEAVNAMLLNEFLKEHRKGEEQDRKIEKLEVTVADLESLVSKQAAQIEKVNAQLAATEPATRLVTTK